MAIKKFKLEKQIWSNSNIKGQLSTKFKKIAKSDTNINTQRIKEIYDEIFYNIPIEGEDSHKNIVEQTYDYLYLNYNRNLDSQIASLGLQISAKSSELDGVDGLNTNENELYEDGSLLMNGAGGAPFQDSNYIWVMQEGRKRRFESDSSPVFIEMKKAMRLPIDHFDGRYFISTSELNNIPDGVPITTTADLNLKGLQLIPEGDMPDIAVRNAYYTVSLKCLGEEIADVNYQLYTDTATVDFSQAQFLLGSEGCTIKYLKDDFSTDESVLTVETVNLSKDEEIQIDILREGLGTEDSGIPSNLNDFYQNNGTYDIQTIQYNGNDVPSYIKNWGPYDMTGFYGSILYATGRITVRQHTNEYIQNTLLIAQPDPEEEEILNGLPNSFTITEGSGIGQEANIAFVDAGGQSAYDTKMIHRGEVSEQLWGNLNQGYWMQENLFNDPSNAYYKTSFSWGHKNRYGTGKVYGQPILRMYEQDTYAVIIGWFVKTSTRYIVFLDIITGDSFYLKHKDTKDYPYKLMLKTHGTTGIDGVSWDQEGTKQRIIWDGYIGLKDYQTIGQEWDGGQGNRFNKHSNYEWVGNL